MTFSHITDCISQLSSSSVVFLQETEIEIWTRNLEGYLTHLENAGGKSLLMRVLSLATLTVQKKSVAKPTSPRKGAGFFSVHIAVLSNGLRSVVPRGMDQKFDLKGHTDGRDVSEEDLERVPSITLKDGDFAGTHIKLNEATRKEFLGAIQRDTQYLEAVKVQHGHVGVMDYSLLIGMQRVKVGDEEVEGLPEPGNLTWHASHVIVAAADVPIRYYIGIIDTATPFGAAKAVQNIFGGFFTSGSAQKPPDYANRLREMCQQVVVCSDIE